MNKEPFKPHDIILNDIAGIVEFIGDVASGLVILSGATGSGKSTSLSGIAYELQAKYDRNVLGIAIGDGEKVAGIPSFSFPEFERFGSLFHASEEEKRIDLIRESEVVGLRLQNVLREDPDVVIFDGIFDVPSALIALNIAEAGSLVIISLHASSPMESLERIDGLLSGHPRYHVNNLVNTLRLAVHQNLIYDPENNRRNMETVSLIPDTQLRDTIRSWNSTPQ